MNGDLFNDAELRQIGDERHERHKAFSPLFRPLSDDYLFLSLKGEQLFAKLFRLSMDRAKSRTAGDGGIDFTLRCGLTVDVKTARKPLFFFHEESKPILADVVCLAGYRDATKSAWFVGWQWDKELRVRAPRAFKPHNIRNYWIPASVLRPMSELIQFERITDWWT